MSFDSMLIPCFRRINSSLTIDVITTALTPENALSLLDLYDIILDCTDNSPTRYLLSDAAVALRKPLVSGAAQKYEGQICLYNLGEKGPCYRCLFPIPPPKETLGSCEESGILGVVTGIIGNMQALETIKLISGLHGKVTLNFACFTEILINFQTSAHLCLFFLLLDFLRFAPSTFDLDK
jgi:molybdopterin/thiamine biosynthesis adenylyltransferase